MEPITRFASRAVVLPLENVDTDQIIPARFLKTTDSAGLGAHLFADWRYGPDGAPRPEFVLNRPEARGAQVLVAGRNFGCGSSREHAPWALRDYGFRAVVSTYFADIFASNAIKNGLLPVVVDDGTYRQLVERVAVDPGAEVTVDLPSQTLTLPGGVAATFPVEPFAKHCLLNGVDQLGFLLEAAPDIAGYEATRPARVHTA
jgi:3-isopropylmalate/(R)-2-methylmalate dehydratase small subunit